MKILISETGCNKSSTLGFTLIEILIVLFILGLSSSLIILNFSTLDSLEKQINSFETKINYLSEESIITGRIIGWYYDGEKDHAMYLDNNFEEQGAVEENIDSGIEEFQDLKKIFKFSDGTILEFNNNFFERRPLIVFYPSGENTGGIFDIYQSNNIQRIIIKNNGKIRNEIISY